MDAKRKDEIRAMLDVATPGPWSWDFIGEKTNGYVIGIACDEEGNQLSGHLEDHRSEDDPMMLDDLVYHQSIGEYEASTCNYKDPELIAAAPTIIAELLADNDRLEKEASEQDWKPVVEGGMPDKFIGHVVLNGGESEWLTLCETAKNGRYYDTGDGQSYYWQDGHIHDESGDCEITHYKPWPEGPKK
jgi:hypothetical protein